MLDEQVQHSDLEVLHLIVNLLDDEIRDKMTSPPFLWKDNHGLRHLHFRMPVAPVISGYEQGHQYALLLVFTTSSLHYCICV